MPVSNKKILRTLTRGVGKGEDKPERLYNKILAEGPVSSHFKPPHGYDYSTFSYKGVPIETLNRVGSHPLKAVLLLHGGGFICQTTDFYRNRMKLFADSIGAIAVLPDYGIMPQNPFPAPLKDILIVWDYLLQSHNPENIVVVGDSAGASLALSLTLALRKRGDKLPRALVCIAPWIDMSVKGNSYYDHFYLDSLYGNFRMPSPDIAEELRKSKLFDYCGDNDRTNPELSPIYADFSGFPNTHICVGNLSITESDALVLADKLKKAGVPTSMDIADNQFGAYALFYNKSSAAKRSMKRILCFMADIFNRRYIKF